jgi:hypothetical protein
MELKLQKFRISLVLNSFFFPLTSTEVFDSLKARGFEIPRPQGPLLTGPRVYVSGVIARKQSVLVDIDGSRNLVGAEGLAIPESLNVFSETMDMLREDFSVNLDRELSYVELIAHYLIKSDNNPFEVIQNAVELRFRDQFRRILNVETSDYRFSITPRGVLPSSREWFEISVSPKLTMPTEAYWVEVIYRNGNQALVTAFASDLNSTISNIISTIEERVRPRE